jgi:hypothetical protein
MESMDKGYKTGKGEIVVYAPSSVCSQWVPRQRGGYWVCFSLLKLQQHGITGMDPGKKSNAIFYCSALVLLLTTMLVYH